MSLWFCKHYKASSSCECWKKECSVSNGLMPDGWWICKPSFTTAVPLCRYQSSLMNTSLIVNPQRPPPNPLLSLFLLHGVSGGSQSWMLPRMEKLCPTSSWSWSSWIMAVQERHKQKVPLSHTHLLSLLGTCCFWDFYLLSTWLKWPSEFSNGCTPTSAVTT